VYGAGFGLFGLLHTEGLGPPGPDVQLFEFGQLQPELCQSNSPLPVMLMASPGETETPVSVHNWVGATVIVVVVCPYPAVEPYIAKDKMSSQKILVGRVCAERFKSRKVIHLSAE